MVLSSPPSWPPSSADGPWRSMVRPGTPRSAIWLRMQSSVLTEVDWQPFGKEGPQWTVIVDDRPWDGTYDMVWKPVFSPNSRNVGAKVEKGGKYTVAIDGKLFKRQCEAAWDPIFSPDGKKVLIRSIEHGKYTRRVVPVTDITG